MKTFVQAKVIWIACVAALASCAVKPETQRMQAPRRPDSPLSERVFREVNAYRHSYGRAPLQRHQGLDRLALEHSEYLRKHRGTFGLHGKNISHFGFEGRALAARTSYQMENVSENVAATSGSDSDPAKTLMDMWKNSKGHDANLVNTWTHTGLGIVVDHDGMVFATQIFAIVSSSNPSLRERFNRF